MAHSPIGGRREFPGTVEDAIASMVPGAIFVVCDGEWSEETKDLLNFRDDGERNCGLAFEQFLGGGTDPLMGNDGAGYLTGQTFEVSVFKDDDDKKERQLQWLEDVEFNKKVGYGYYRATEEDGREEIIFISVGGKKVGLCTNTQCSHWAPKAYYLTPSALKALMKKFLRSMEYFQFLYDEFPSKKTASNLVKFKLGGKAPPGGKVPAYSPPAPTQVFGEVRRGNETIELSFNPDFRGLVTGADGRQRCRQCDKQCWLDDAAQCSRSVSIWRLTVSRGSFITWQVDGETLEQVLEKGVSGREQHAVGFKVFQGLSQAELEGLKALPKLKSFQASSAKQVIEAAIGAGS